MSEQPTITGNIIEDTTIAAGAPWSRVINKDEMMRIVDLEGKQAVDFLCWNAQDHEDHENLPSALSIDDEH